MNHHEIAKYDCLEVKRRAGLKARERIVVGHIVGEEGREFKRLSAKCIRRTATDPSDVLPMLASMAGSRSAQCISLMICGVRSAILMHISREFGTYQLSVRTPRSLSLALFDCPVGNSLLSAGRPASFRRMGSSTGYENLRSRSRT